MNSCIHVRSSPGSPPHTRGRSPSSAGTKVIDRFTPAYAGKILDSAFANASLEVHPRIRGEDHNFLFLIPYSLGSPPHTRGRLLRTFFSTLANRFTPAYAGKIFAASSVPRIAKVHPRIRGEDKMKIQELHKAVGSPPHTRGRLLAEKPRRSSRRFTPAYAGKMGRPSEPVRRAQVHPRIRGEDSGGDARRRQGRGSPPHTRGRFDELDTCTPGLRFTPAYAGKMLCNIHAERTPRVHPRIRGEDPGLIASLYLFQGSPPHTRGRFQDAARANLVSRFTPAYAGKIYGYDSGGRGRRVHPRIRGEDGSRR